MHSQRVRTSGSEPQPGQNLGDLPVLEAVGDQLSFGQVVQPGELPAAVSAGIERREALVAPLQLHTEPELRAEPLTQSPGQPVLDLTSEGRAKVQDCWKGQDPELRTWILKSTETRETGSEPGPLPVLGASEGSGSAPTVQRFRVAEVLLELLVQVFADSDVLEHALQFGRVLEAARLLQGDRERQNL